MRKSILIAALILAACSAYAQQTLTIIEQDYELARETALQQHKLLIVDFYTTWCMPCKKLDNMIFKNDSIAHEISKNFVVLKYDAEKDSVHNLSLKHHICSYPTTIVLTGNGKLINKMFGLGGADFSSLTANYTNLLTESMLLDKQGKYVEGVSTTIDPAIYPAFYKKYVRRTADIKPDDLSTYWSNNKRADDEVSFAILAYFGEAPEPVVDYFIQHKSRYEQRFGKKDVMFVVSNLTSGKFRAAIAAKDEARYQSAIRFMRKQLPAADADEYLQAYSMEMYIALEKWERAIDNLDERIRLKKINANGINYFCWKVYEHCSEKKVIGRAVQLMKNVTDTQPSFGPLDTYARLLAKNGNKEEAIVEMKRAIEKGKAAGEDTKESEEALSKF